jgi:hypothetical protein
MPRSGEPETWAARLDSVRASVVAESTPAPERVRKDFGQPRLNEGKRIDNDLFELRIFGPGGAPAQERFRAQLEEGHEVLPEGQVVDRRLDIRARGVERAGRDKSERLLDQPIDCGTAGRRMPANGTAVGLVPRERRTRLPQVRRNAHGATLARVACFCEGGKARLFAVSAKKVMSACLVT